MNIESLGETVWQLARRRRDWVMGDITEIVLESKYLFVIERAYDEGLEEWMEEERYRKTLDTKEDFQYWVQKKETSK